ncbi:DUF4178 domain-containing protein [Paenibacillus hunanensis]|uniref:DUF4178 domain-containing protein n=1 Tax=Paenibacillus hunanensis TaxID=539262 RepID=UPI002A69E22A|nr:DUF4178 domain-containing protein [Paenibacillus hunanensis]WPP43392.1 DUF4178 domain-containing protein [Paenibacillus hunanensis]
MGLWKRITNLMSKPEAPKPEKSPLDLQVGDICEVSLVTYEIVGTARNRARNTVMLTLQDGSSISYLHVEMQEKLRYALYQPIDGGLDNPNEVPTHIEMDGTDYYLDEQYSGMVMSTGRTPVLPGAANGEQYVWQHQSDDRKLLRIEWQGGRFTLYEGEWVLNADVRVIRAS